MDSGKVDCFLRENGFDEILYRFLKSDEAREIASSSIDRIRISCNTGELRPIQPLLQELLSGYTEEMFLQDLRSRLDMHIYMMLMDMVDCENNLPVPNAFKYSAIDIAKQVLQEDNSVLLKKATLIADNMVDWILDETHRILLSCLPYSIIVD